MHNGNSIIESSCGSGGEHDRNAECQRLWTPNHGKLANKVVSFDASVRKLLTKGTNHPDWGGTSEMFEDSAKGSNRDSILTNSLVPTAHNSQAKPNDDPIHSKDNNDDVGVSGNPPERQRPRSGSLIVTSTCSQTLLANSKHRGSGPEDEIGTGLGWRNRPFVNSGNNEILEEEDSRSDQNYLNSRGGTSTYSADSDPIIQEIGCGNEENLGQNGEEGHTNQIKSSHLGGKINIKFLCAGPLEGLDYDYSHYIHGWDYGADGLDLFEHNEIDGDSLHVLESKPMERSPWSGEGNSGKSLGKLITMQVPKEEADPKMRKSSLDKYFRDESKTPSTPSGSSEDEDCAGVETQKLQAARHRRGNFLTQGSNRKSPNIHAFINPTFAYIDGPQRNLQYNTLLNNSDITHIKRTLKKEYPNLFDSDRISASGKNIQAFEEDQPPLSPLQSQCSNFFPKTRRDSTGNGEATPHTSKSKYQRLDNPGFSVAQDRRSRPLGDADPDFLSEQNYPIGNNGDGIRFVVDNDSGEFNTSKLQKPKSQTMVEKSQKNGLDTNNSKDSTVSVEPNESASPKQKLFSTGETSENSELEQFDKSVGEGSQYDDEKAKQNEKIRNKISMRSQIMLNNSKMLSMALGGENSQNNGKEVFVASSGRFKHILKIVRKPKGKEDVPMSEGSCSSSVQSV
jgi:hypothetical protein